MCQPSPHKEEAVDNWYIAACYNLGVDFEAFPPESAEHEAILDAAHALRTEGATILDGETLVLHTFGLSA
jgi:hypothetical protein